jgi:type IV secretory pathway TrbD component
MKARIEELNEFYDANATDPKVHFFESLRIKLKKALHKKVDLTGSKRGVALNTGTLSKPYEE